jgi:hypothetical protein
MSNLVSLTLNQALTTSGDDFVRQCLADSQDLRYAHFLLHGDCLSGSTTPDIDQTYALLATGADKHDILKHMSDIIGRECMVQDQDGAYVFDDTTYNDRSAAVIEVLARHHQTSAIAEIREWSTFDDFVQAEMELA